VIPEIRTTNRFILRVRCEVRDLAASGVILALRSRSGPDGFSLVQRGPDVIFALRTPDLGKSTRWQLDFKGTLERLGPHELTVTYDGSRLAGNIDGGEGLHPVDLTPGPILVKRFRGIGPYNVPGYARLYDMLVFMPLGGLLALAARRPRPRQRWAWMTMGFLLPPFLQEGILSGATGSSFHLWPVVAGICLTLGALLIVNSDS